jgi:small multidrug resistance pump
MSFFLLFLAGTCGAAASILLRLAGRMEVAAGVPLNLAMLVSPAMLLRFAAVGAYGLGFVVYATALRRVELSIAYPLMVGITILEIFAFGLFAGEAMNLRTWLGAAMLVAAIGLLYTS